MNWLDYGATLTDDALIDSQVKEYLTFFLENGYVVIPGNTDFLEKISRATTCFYKFKENNRAITKPIQDDNGFLRRIVNLHCYNTEIVELFTENPSLSFLDYLMGEATLYTSLTFEKGSGQDIHRDTPYFWTSPPYQYVGMWVALEDTDKENGPLRVVKGGHKLPELDLESIASKFYDSMSDINPYSDELWLEYQTQLQTQYQAAGLTEQEVHVPKGSTIIWHPQLPHGGSPIVNDNRTRLSMAMHITPPNVAVYHQDVFFSQKIVPSKKEIFYKFDKNRRYIAHDTISFGHLKDYRFKDIL
jgi:phytanoyl-CoA hydroxylase